MSVHATDPEPMFTAAIFDMDGLLIDSERTLLGIWMQVAQELGGEMREADFVRMVGLGSAESNLILGELLGSEEQVLLLRRRASELLRPGGVAPVYPLRAGALELLGALGQGEVPCAVASSTRIAEVQRCLRDAKVHHHFRHFAGGDEVPRSKPDPAVFLLAAERLGVTPGECLVFEDSLHGVTAARAAGMQVVMVPDLVVPDATLDRHLFARVDSLHAVVPHVQTWFRSGAAASATTTGASRHL